MGKTARRIKHAPNWITQFSVQQYYMKIYWLTMSIICINTYTARGAETDPSWVPLVMGAWSELYILDEEPPQVCNWLMMRWWRSGECDLFGWLRMKIVCWLQVLIEMDVLFIINIFMNALKMSILKNMCSANHCNRPNAANKDPLWGIINIANKLFYQYGAICINLNVYAAGVRSFANHTRI